MVCMYLELVEGILLKFWEIIVEGIEYIVCYGKIGMDGCMIMKLFVFDEEV